MAATAPAQLVDARLLHTFLEVGKDFSTWIKERIHEYDFIENIDFLLPKFGEQKQRGGHNKIDYHLTLDMAKELGMIERNEKGRQIRRYFLEMERLAKTQPLENIEQLPTLPAPRARRAVKGGLQLRQQDAMNDLIKARLANVAQNRRGGIAVSIYSAINTKFETKGMKDGYKNIAPEHFDNVMPLIARLPLDEKLLLTFSHEELTAIIRENQGKALQGEVLPKEDSDSPMRAAAFTGVDLRLSFDADGKPQVVQVDKQPVSVPEAARHLEAAGYLVVKKSEVLGRCRVRPQQGGQGFCPPFSITWLFWWAGKRCPPYMA